MSRYRKVEVRTWSDKKFRALTPIPPCGRGLWLFLMTGPHTGPIPGLFRAGRAALAEELGWDIEDFDKAFSEVLAQGMAEADFEARLVWLPNAIKHNQPQSPNVVRSWYAEFDLLPECELKTRAVNALKAYISGLDKGFIKAFEEAMGTPSTKTSPNQEQETGTGEQEQESTSASVTPTRPPAVLKVLGGPVNPEWFRDFKLAYPNRAGDQGWHKALKAANARIAEGHMPDEFLGGARRYGAFCDATEKTGTEFVKQAATFLGPDKPFLLPWDLPLTKADVRQAQNISAAMEFMRNTDGATT